MPLPRTVSIAAVMLTLAGCAALPADPGVSASSSATAAVSVERRMQCENIRRAWAQFERDASRLASLGTLNGDQLATEVFTESLKETAEDLSNATSGYPDPETKALTLAASDFEFELSLLTLENSLGGKFKDETYASVLSKAVTLDKAYKTFSATC